jgi:hypothetical protein
LDVECSLSVLRSVQLILGVPVLKAIAHFVSAASLVLRKLLLSGNMVRLRLLLILVGLSLLKVQNPMK